MDTRYWEAVASETVKELQTNVVSISDVVNVGNGRGHCACNFTAVVSLLRFICYSCCLKGYGMSWTVQYSNRRKDSVTFVQNLAWERYSDLKLLDVIPSGTIHFI